MEGVTLFLVVLMFAQASAADEKKEKVSLLSSSEDKAELKCDGNWVSLSSPTLKIDHRLDRSDIENCGEVDSTQVYVRIRTTENLIEVQPMTLSLIVVGNVVMYVLIGVVVYNLSSQPRAQRTFSGNKASDKQVLIPNGERDTYQPLNPTQKSEYSTLGVGKRH